MTAIHNPMLEDYEAQDLEEIYGVRKEDYPYHPYYYIPQSEEVMEDPLYKAIQAYKAERNPRRRRTITERSALLEKVKNHPKTTHRNIMNEWISQRVIKDSKKGRPKKYTELEIRAIKDTYISWEFGFKRISAVLSNEPLARKDQKVFTYLLINAKWNKKDILELQDRIWDGKSRMSAMQAKRLYDEGDNYLS